MKSAAMDGRLLTLAIKDDRKGQAKSAARDGRFSIRAIKDDRTSR